jgi:hypothetical protein
VNVGQAAEKAAKREAAAALSVNPANTDKEKESENGGAKFGKGAHA